MGALNPYTSSLTLNGGTVNWSITNKGIAGETLATMLANAPTAIDPLFNSKLPRNVLVLEGGTNDIATAHTPASVYANMTAYIAARHAVGWTVVVWTMLSRVGWDITKDQLNTLILANSGGTQGAAGKWDGIVDETGTPLGIDGGYLNTLWFQPDEIHPTSPGVTTYEAPPVSAAVNALP